MKLSQFSQDLHVKNPILVKLNQSIFNGSIILWTTKTGSRYGGFEPLRVNHSARSASEANGNNLGKSFRSSI